MCERAAESVQRVSQERHNPGLVSCNFPRWLLLGVRFFVGSSLRPFVQAQSRLDRVLTYYRRQETSSSVSSRMRDSTSEPCLTGQPLSSHMEGNLTVQSDDRGARPRGTLSGAMNLHTLTREVSRSEVHRDLVPRCCREEEEVFVDRNTCRSLDHSPRCSDRHTVASAGECASVQPVHTPDESFSGASSAVFGVSSSSRGSFSSIEEKSEQCTRACNSSIGSEQEEFAVSREEGHQPTRTECCSGSGGEEPEETARPCQVTGISSCSPSPCPSPCEGSTRAGPSQSSSVVSPSYKALSPGSLASMESEFSSWLRRSEGMERSEEKVEERQYSRRGEVGRMLPSGEGRGDRRRDMVAAKWRKGGQEHDSASEDEEEGFSPSILDHLERQIASEEESDNDGYMRDEEEEDHPLRVRRSIASVITTEFVDPSSDEEEEDGMQRGGAGRHVRTTSSAAEEKWWRMAGGACSQGSELEKLEYREGEHQGGKEDGEASSNEEEDETEKSNGSVAEVGVKEESALRADAGASGASTDVPAGFLGDRACQRMRMTNRPRHRGSCPPCSRRPRVQASRLRRHSVQPIFLPAAWRRRASSLIHQSHGFQTSTPEMISSPANTFHDLSERLLAGGSGDGLVETSLCRVQQQGDEESCVQSKGVQSPSRETSPVHGDTEGEEPATANGCQVFSSTKEGLAHVLSLQLRENQLKWELLYRGQLAFVHFQESSQRRRQRGLELLHAHQTACASFSSFHPLLPNRTYSSSQHVSSSYTPHPPCVSFTRASDSFPSSSPPRVMHASARNPVEEPSRNRRPAALHRDLATSASSSAPVCVPLTPRGRRGVTESYPAASGFPSCLIDNASSRSPDTPDYRFVPQGTPGVPRFSPLPTGLSPGFSEGLCPGSLSATSGRSCEVPLGGEGGLEAGVNAYQVCDNTFSQSPAGREDSRGYGDSLPPDGSEFSSSCAGLGPVPSQPNSLPSRPSPALYSGSAPVVSTVPSQSLHASSLMACSDSSGACSSVREAVSLERTPGGIYRTESLVGPQASSSSSARVDDTPALYLALSPLPTSGPASPINCRPLQRSEEQEEGERREGRGEGESLSFSQHPVVTRDTIGGIPSPPVWVREEEDPEDAIAFAQAAAIAARGGRGDSRVGQRDGGGRRNIVGGGGRRGEIDDGAAVPMCLSSSWIESNTGIGSTPGSLPIDNLGGRGTTPPPSIQVTTTPSSAARGNSHHITDRCSGVIGSSSSLSVSTPHLLGGRPISPRHSSALDPTPLTCVSAASGTCRDTSTAFEISQFATSAGVSSSPLVNPSPFPAAVSSSSSSRDGGSSSTSSPLSAPPPLPHSGVSCPPSSCFSQHDSPRHPRYLRGRQQEQSPRNPERTHSSRDTYALPSPSTPPPFPYSSSLPSASSPAVIGSAIPSTNPQTHRRQNGQSGERDAMRLLHSPSYQSTPENVSHADRQRQSFSSELAHQDCQSAAQICLQHRDIFERQLRKNEAHLEGLRVLMNRLLVVMEQISGRDSTSN